MLKLLQMIMLHKIYVLNLRNEAKVAINSKNSESKLCFDPATNFESKKVL